MKYGQIQMITELCAMTVGAHVALQPFWDHIDLLHASLAGIDEITSEIAIVLDV